MPPLSEVGGRVVGLTLFAQAKPHMTCDDLVNPIGAISGELPHPIGTISAKLVLPFDTKSFLYYCLLPLITVRELQTQSLRQV